jgi:hypothetical protein
VHPHYHAVSSARRHGGKLEDYLPLHNWFDASKEFMCDFRHRALRHHAQGVFEAERVFGTAIVNSDGKHVPTRILGEQHVWEDCGRIPTLADWLRAIKGEKWMLARSSAQSDRVTDEPAWKETTHTQGLEPLAVSSGREDWPQSDPTHATDATSGYAAPAAPGDRLLTLRR